MKTYKYNNLIINNKIKVYQNLILMGNNFFYLVIILMHLISLIIRLK